jgi:hypothetical protein
MSAVGATRARSGPTLLAAALVLSAGLQVTPAAAAPGRLSRSGKSALRGAPAACRWLLRPRGRARALGRPQNHEILGVREDVTADEAETAYRELQVLRLLDSTLTGPEIARELFVSRNPCAATPSTSSPSSAWSDTCCSARHRDLDEAVLQASGLRGAPPWTDLAGELLHIVAKLNPGIDADPELC